MMCHDTRIRTHENIYSAEGIFRLNLNTKNQIRKTQILGRLTACIREFPGGLVSVLLKLIAVNE